MQFPFDTPAFKRVTKLAALRSVHAAFAWIHANPKTIMDWQTELVTIPGPPFGEEARSVWMEARFSEAGLHNVYQDEIGNVYGTLPAANLPAESTGHVIVISAHLDTVFPASTPLNPIVDHLRLEAPGASDNAAGVVGMLAIAHAFVQSRIEIPLPLVFIGNVGEEGEGDLRGVRHLYSQNALAGRIAAHIILDGSGSDIAVTQALGSRRFQVSAYGPGGHSFSDAGTPNPIAALSIALSTLTHIQLPVDPRTTINFGTIQGGTSVNSIPESAQASIDFRSTDTAQLQRLEIALHHAIEDAVDRTNAIAQATSPGHRGQLTYTIEKIGDRPAAKLSEDAALLSALYAVDRHLNLHTDLRLGSTDANLPLSLGVEALSMGAGGEGEGAHTLGEWYSALDRETGLRRVMLLTLTMLDWAAEL